jgi:trk system potassium uptake protein TrkA
MRVIVVGAGEVGSYLSDIMSRNGHTVTMIESDEERAQNLNDEQESNVICGDGHSCQTLVDCHISECDFFMAMTSDDRTNILSSSLAKALGAKYTVARIHDKTFIDNSLVNFQHHFGIDFLLNPEALCAVELVKSMRNPYRVAIENFARGKIEVQQVEVARRSRAAGKTVQDIKLDHRVRIGYVQSEHSTKVATADTQIHAGDKITLFGEQEALYDAKVLFDPGGTSETVKVVLMGGSEIAVSIVRLLKNPRFKIKIIEKDTSICETLAEMFPHVSVINGDGTSLRILEEEHVGECDFFVACTKQDENNIMTCVQAAKLGAKDVQVAINKSDYEEILDGLKNAMGVSMIVSPRLATANEVLRSLSTDSFIELGTLLDGEGKILELRIPPGAAVVGKRIKEIVKPKEVVLVALLHKFQVKVPGADDMILAGDRIIVITKEQEIQQVIRTFTL